MIRFTQFTILFLVAFSALAQQTKPTALDTLIIADPKLDEFSVGQTLSHLSDSTITKNSPALTDLLTFNSPIYFKENGKGMVSSPSFRGTTAQQTAVLWNGLNINSAFLGQTDFNTINTGSYNAIDVRAGGGSLVYGSGAIGGTVHLKTNIEYKEAFSNRLHLGYGSYNTIDGRYRLKLSNKKYSLLLSLAGHSSDNDFKLHRREGRNKNGQFHNTALNLALGVRLNPKNQLRFYSEFYDGLRHFSLIRPSENKSKYRDTNSRNLLEWQSRFGRFKSILKTAFLSEHYKYFQNLKYDQHTNGKAETALAKYNLSFKPINSLLIDATVSHRHTNGFGSDIKHEVRNITSGALLVKHQLAPDIKYQVGIRKEITQSYESPVLYSFGLDYALTSFYTAKISASKNFRRPTYNDLYWKNSGDLDLKAEQSHQIEIGNVFTCKNWRFTLTGFFNDINDMIHWLPATGGIFKPHNVDHVQTYGLESLVHWEHKFSNQSIGLDGSYAYTVSKNKKTHKQLIYVPYHKANASINYRIGRLSANYQILFNGEVYTRSDNDPSYNLSSYSLSNLGLSYAFDEKHNYILGLQAKNVFDKTYENVENREMPGINYNVYLTLNF